MKTNETRIIEKLLEIISQSQTNEEYKDMILFTEIHNLNDVSIYKLCVKGESNKGTPFYCASETTFIVKEDYCEGELVYASIEFDEFKRSF